MDVVSALKRLERAGSEHSRATEKLLGAASEMADWLCGHLPWVGGIPGTRYELHRVYSHRVNSGRTYLVRRRDSDDFSQDEGWVARTEDWLNGSEGGAGGYFCGDFSCPVPEATRRGALLFAEDLAGGLLETIADLLERENAEADGAAERLRAAAEAMGGRKL